MFTVAGELDIPCLNSFIDKFSLIPDKKEPLVDVGDNSLQFAYSDRYDFIFLFRFGRINRIVVNHGVCAIHYHRLDFCIRSLNR